MQFSSYENARSLSFRNPDKTNLEHKRLIEDRVQCFLVHFGVKLLLLLRQELDFNVRIRGAARVHGHEVRSLKDANCEL